LSFAINWRCCSERAHVVHVCAQASGCYGSFYRDGGRIGSAAWCSSSLRLSCVGAVEACGCSGDLAHVAAGVADARGSAASPRPYCPNEPRKRALGRTAHPWRIAEARVRCIPGHGVPLHATAKLSAAPELAHLPAEPGTRVRYDRSWRRRSDIRPTSHSRARVDRAGCRVRHHQGAGWHLLQAYRATMDLATVEAISLFQWY
jgi:hypothetical protein